MSDTMTETAWAQGSRLAASGASFASPDFLAQIDGLSPQALDATDFGIVKVDDTGKILFYNRYESELAGVTQAHATGKNFFTEIAPCTNNRLFMGTFKKGVEQKAMSLLFFYTFTYKMSPTEVKVHLYRSPGGANWILVKKK